MHQHLSMLTPLDCHSLLHFIILCYCYAESSIAYIYICIKTFVCQLVINACFLFLSWYCSRFYFCNVACLIYIDLDLDVGSQYKRLSKVGAHVNYWIALQSLM